MNDSERKAIEVRTAKLLSEGADTETLLQFMRENGLGQPDSVLTLMKLANVDLGEAQMIVFRSKTWADRLAVNMQMQNDLMQALCELKEENDDPNFEIEVEWEKPDWPKL